MRASSSGSTPTTSKSVPHSVQETISPSSSSSSSMSRSLSHSGHKTMTAFLQGIGACRLRKRCKRSRRRRAFIYRISSSKASRAEVSVSANPCRMRAENYVERKQNRQVCGTDDARVPDGCSDEDPGEENDSVCHEVRL